MRHAWARQAARARTHYNALATRAHRGSGSQSERVRRTRATHNWIKALLIRRVDRLLGRVPARVLELCGGRGGDVGKWQRAGTTLLTLVDASERSLDEARRRYSLSTARAITSSSSMSSTSSGASLSSTSFSLATHVGDAFDTLPASLCTESYDVVSCQFALHYAFESRERACAAFAAAARAAAPDALFVATLPHADRLRAEAHAHHSPKSAPQMPKSASQTPTTNALALMRHGNDASSRAHADAVVFGDDVFRVEATSLAAFDADFGGRYTFTFDGAVDALDEFVVQRASLESVLDECGWTLTTYEPVDAFLAKATRDDALAESLRTRMRADAHDRLSRVTRLYAVVVATRKRTPRCGGASTLLSTDTNGAVHSINDGRLSLSSSSSSTSSTFSSSSSSSALALASSLSTSTTSMAPRDATTNVVTSTSSE